MDKKDSLKGNNSQSKRSYEADSQKFPSKKIIILEHRDELVTCSNIPTVTEPSSSPTDIDQESVKSMSISIGSEDMSVSISSDKGSEVGENMSNNETKTYSIKKGKGAKGRSAAEKRIRPNYFVGIQISNPAIHGSIAEVQKALIDYDSRMTDAVIDVATLHLTLLVAHAANEDDLNKMCSALDHCGASLIDSLSNPPLRITFRGLSNFSHKILFANIVEDENYHRLLLIGKETKRIFSERGICLTDDRDFTPHLTVAKLSKIPWSKEKKGLRKIDNRSYKPFIEYTFGTQIVRNLQVLAMGPPKDENRYYRSARQVAFDIEESEETDHSKCCLLQPPESPAATAIPSISEPSAIPSISVTSVTEAISEPPAASATPSISVTSEPAATEAISEPPAESATPAISEPPAACATPSISEPPAASATPEIAEPSATSAISEPPATHSKTETSAPTAAVVPNKTFSTPIPKDDDVGGVITNETLLKGLIGSACFLSLAFAASRFLRN